MNNKISVIVPIRNMEQYIEECLLSILKSDEKPAEIIVVDFGSTDTSLEIIKKIATQEPSVSLVFDPQGDAASARNFGLKESTGDFVVFIDCDDWIAPDMLSVLHSKMLEGNYDIVSCCYQNVYSDGREEKISFPERCVAVDENNINEVLSWVALGGMSAELWTKMYRADFLKSHNVWLESENGINGEDVFFNYSALLHQPRLATVSHAPYYHRIRENSLAHRKMTPLVKRFTTIINNLLALARKNGLYADAGIAQLYISLIIQDATTFKSEKEQLDVLDGYLKNYHLNHLLKLAFKNPQASLKRKFLCALLALKWKKIIVRFLPK